MSTQMTFLFMLAVSGENLVINLTTISLSFVEALVEVNYSCFLSTLDSFSKSFVNRILEEDSDMTPTGKNELFFLPQIGRD